VDVLAVEVFVLVALLVADAVVALVLVLGAPVGVVEVVQ